MENLNAKEKANELIDKYMNVEVDFPTWSNKNEIRCIHSHKAKKCALICVNEILSICTTSYFISYWSNVKSEIEKL